MNQQTPERGGNRLLAVLSPGDSADLRAQLQRVALTQGRSLHKAHSPIEYVYFPEVGIISLVKPLKDGATIEVGLVGREGMIGTILLMGGASSPLEAMVQLPGSALRLPAAMLPELLARYPDLDAAVRRFYRVLLAQIVQSAACNGRHTVPQRLARWLLMVHDRVDGDELPLKHEFISLLLGIRRAGVSVAVSGFKALGLVATRHGRIVLLDRAGLEAASCECYRTLVEQSRSLLDRSQ
jgi:CRP-like cAMP-binding protein